MTKTNAYGFFQIFLIFSKYVKKQTQMHMVSLKYFKYILISIKIHQILLECNNNKIIQKQVYLT